MTHILDRPAWSALQSVHASLAEGGAAARRYPPSIVPFGAAADRTAESLDALADLLHGEELMALAESQAMPLPDRLLVVSERELVQMIAQRPYERISDARVAPLSWADAADMLDLATLTKPGPFTLGARRLGTFWGVKIDGRLVAMAGQRMRQPGFTELSGLCTHPDFQGRGLGRLLFLFVAGEISARQETVYLHTLSTNTTAISLYEKLGFRVRARLTLTVVQRREIV